MHPLPHPISRRAMLQRSAAGFGSLAFTHLLASEQAAVLNPLAPRKPQFPARAKSVIFLFMDGGPGQMDTFDPKPRLTAENGQPLPFKEKSQFNASGKVLASPFQFAQYGQSGAWVSELFPNVAQCVDDLCIVRSMYHEQVSHANGCYLMHTGHTFAGRPSMGAWVTYGLGSESSNLPGFVVINCGTIPSGGAQNFSNGFLPAIYQGTIFKGGENPLADVRPLEESASRQQHKLDLIRRLDSHRIAQLGGDSTLDAALSNYEMAFRMQSAVPELSDLTGESGVTLQQYGIGDKTTDAFGRGCLLARRMVERGVRFVQVTSPDIGANRWDQHQDLDKGHRANAAATDKGIAALLRDLKSRGLLNDTLVVWGGEFGRTPGAEAPRGGKPPTGRDHNPHGFTMWMAGGGVKPGHVHGATDDYGYAAVQDKVHVHDLHATILHLLGFDHERLTYRHAGRDFRLTDVSGEVVRGVIA
jgi:hypothetical protein